MVAAAVVATSAAPASAEGFFFRYKQPASWSPGANPVDPSDPSIGVGNDITIYFTGAIGIPFSKVIPVKTKDVVEWRLQSGNLQDGLVLGSDTGVVSGTPSGKTNQKKAVLVGYDVSGRYIARATITSRFHDPAGQATDFTFYGHTNKYMYRQIPATVPVTRWESIVPDLPDDFRTEGRYFAGTPSQEYTTGVGFIGYDYMDKEVAFTYGDLIVQDNPVLSHIPDLTQHPSKNFVAQPNVQYKVGELTYRLVALDGRPSSTGFNSKTGRLSTRIDTFSTSRRFRIEAIDVDGTVGTTNVFTFTTASPDVDMSKMKDQTGTLNKEFSLQITGKDLSGAMNWQVVEGELPSGISLDAATGEIRGIPQKVEKKTGIVIAVSTSDGGTGQTPAFDFEIFPDPISIAFVPVETRVNRAFTTDGPTMGSGVKTPYSFDLAQGAVVDNEITVDFEAAKATGTLETAGDHSIPFNFINGDGREQVFTQPITIHDDLALAYDDLVTLYRRTPASVAPSNVAGIIGNGSFVLQSGSLPEGVTVNSGTGELVGTPGLMGTYTDLSVKVADESGESVISNDFEIEVEDRPNVAVSSSDVQIERFVDNVVPAASAQNTFDGVTFELVGGTLPTGLSLDEDGVIRGATEDLEGVYSDLQIQATDGEGYVGLGPMFSITVVPPAALAPLNPAGNNSNVTATWVEGVPFSLPLPVPSNAFGTIVYDLQPLQNGVSVSGDRLVGTISQTGDYVYQFTLIDDSRRTLSGTYTLSILEPMTATLKGRGKQGDEETNDVSFALPRGGDTIIAPDLQNAIGAVTTVFSGTLPDGLAYADGSITGKPTTKDQTGEFTLVLTDEAGTSVTLHADIVIGDRVPLTVNYNPSTPVGTVGSTMSVIKPAVVDAIGPVTYAVSGTLPDGVQFDAGTGNFYGTPSVAGWFQGISVLATDSEGPNYAGSYGPFAMQVSLPGVPTVASAITFTVRAGEPFERVVTASNVMAPIVFSPSSGDTLAHGLTLGGFDGKIQGMLPEPGKYVAGGVRIIDSMNREAVTTVNFVAVGPVEITAPTATEFNQYGLVSAASAAKNTIGAVKYSLVSGSLPGFLSLDPNTGVVQGPADAMGTWSGLVVRVTDSTGMSADTSAFSVTIGPRLPLTLDTAATYAAVTGKNFKLTLPVSNAVGAKTFVLTGNLPDGITFDAVKGVFSGKAASLGLYPMTVQVTDSKGGSDAKSFTIVADTNGKPINLNVTEFVTKVGEPIRTTVPTYSNHVGVVRYWADDMLADYGLSVDPDTGVITGTATQLMDIAPNVHITDASLRVTSKPVSIKVVPDLVANVPAKIDLTVNKRVWPWMFVTADYAIGPTDWTIEGTLPKGLNFSTKLRRFSGTPTEMGVFPITLTVTERQGFAQTAVANVEISVVTDGLSPGVTVKPSDVGYYTSLSSTITPTYTNFKQGDVLSLAPGSGPLPPGYTFEPNSTGRYVIKRPAGDVADAGIYSNIIVRVTSTDGLYGDSAPFTIILKNGFNYPVVRVSLRAYDPISLPTPVSTSGKPIGTTKYSFYSDPSKGTATINPDTGEISGYVTKSTNFGVRVVDTHQGKTLRSTSYVIYMTATAMSVTIPADQVTFTGVSYPTNYVTTVTNGIPAGVLSLEGLVPPGLSLDPLSGKVIGTATQAGVYPVDLVYTDPNQRIVTPFTIHVEQSAEAGKGYKYLRVAVTNRQDHLDKLSIKGEYGLDLMHMVSKGTGTISDAVYAQLVGAHTAINFGSGKHQDFVLPVSMAKGSISTRGHGTATVAFYGSVDGQTWDQIGSQTNQPTYSASFAYSGPPGAPFAFNSNGLAAAEDKSSYSLDLRTLVDASTLDGISASSLTWSWTVDPDRDTSSTMPTLPAGLGINGSMLTGTPSAEGTYAVVLTGSYGNRSVSKAFSLVVSPAGELFAFNTTGLTDGMAQIAYSFDLRTLANSSTLAVPVSNISWQWALDPNRDVSSTKPSLPAGMSISGSTLRGTPTEDGTYGLVLTGSYNGRSVSKPFLLLVKPLQATMTLQGAELQSGERWVTPFNVNMFDHLTAPGVTLSEVRWSVVTAGVTAQFGETVGIPAELALGTSTGAITGTSSSIGKWRFAVKATWKTLSTTAEYVIEITGAPTTEFRFTRIASRDNHTCGIMTSGKVACWGAGADGRLGNNAVANSTVPVDVTGIAQATSFVDLKVNATGSCGITSTGSVECWGAAGRNEGNAFGATGLYAKPAPSLESGVSSMGFGGWIGCYVQSGAVKCRGWNEFKVASSSSDLWIYQPTQISGLTSGQKAVTVGGSHACALTTGGAVRCWGLRTDGKLGNGSTATTAVAAPVSVTGLSSGVKAIEAGTEYTCAITGTNGVKCWGNNGYGNLGDNTTTSQANPVDVYGLTSGVQKVSTGYRHACALTTGGGVKCWGQNANGQLGNGTKTRSSVPVEVQGLSSGVIDIAAGASHTCALLSDQTHRCWGLNTSGQLGDGTLVEKLVP